MCGAVTLTLRAVPADYGTCHCEMCRRWTGSALLGVTVQQDDVMVGGADNVRTIQSSDWAERAWCDRCGSGLWYRVTAPGPHYGAYEIPIGLLEAGRWRPIGSGLELYWSQVRGWVSGVFKT